MSDIQVLEIVEDNDVVIFGKGDKGKSPCEMTNRLQEIFEEVFPDYEMIDVESDPGIGSEVRSVSGCSVFPQVFIYGEFAGDFDTICDMKEDGELNDLFDES